jgi:hypothetical protein
MGNRPFEAPVGERVILDLDGEPLDRRIQAGAFAQLLRTPSSSSRKS